MYLRNHGATVEVNDDPERDAFRAAKGIGDDVASCHTAEVDGYLVEGHVPVEAITRLLAERPDAVGLALPGMEGLLGGQPSRKPADDHAAEPEAAGPDV